MLLLLYSLTLVYFRLLHGRFTSSSNSTLVYGFLPRLSIFSSLFHRIWPARYEDICKFHFIAYGFIVTVYCTIWLYFQSIRRKYTSYTDILYTVRFLRQLSIYLSWFRANWSRTNRFIINFLFYCDLPVCYAILHVMAKSGLLPTPNSPRMTSNNLDRFVKPSLFPLPYPAIHIIESLEINSSPSWLLNVTKTNINFKIEWDVIDKSELVNSVDIFPKPVIQSLSTYSVHDPVWSTSLNNKKICLKIDWKFMKPNQSPSQLNPTPSTSFYPPSTDYGYSSATPSSRHQSRVYHSPQSPFPHTVLFPNPHFSPNRQDIYTSPTKPKPQHNFPHPDKVNTVKSTAPVNLNPNSLVFQSKPVAHSSPDCTSVPNSSSTDPIIPPASITTPNLPVSASSSNITPLPSPPSVPSPPPPPPPPFSPPPPSDPILEDSSIPETSPPPPMAPDHSKNSPHNLCTTEYPPLSNDKSLPKTGPTKRRKKKNRSKSKPIALDISSSSHLENVPPPSDPPQLPSVNILRDPPIFIINDRSQDGDIRTDIDPTSPDFLPQDNCFLPSPPNIPLGPDGSLDPHLRADRMNILGKCRLCKVTVPSHAVDLHLLQCTKLVHHDVDNLAMEHADITNKNYSDMINIVYDYVQCIMHDDVVSNLFWKVSLFTKFLHDIEHLMDCKARSIFQLTNMSGDQKRFNILDYST